LPSNELTDEVLMKKEIKRREFLQMTSAAVAIGFSGLNLIAFAESTKKLNLISPGCRKTKVKVARVYMGSSTGLWPKANLDFKEEVKFYQSQFEKMKKEFADVDFTIDELVTTNEQAISLKNKLADVDGILAIHFNIGISEILKELLSVGKPTVLFAVPYSGHEWVNFGNIMKQPIGSKMECILSSDYNQLAVAIRPFRAIHHLREAKILNLTTRDFTEYANAIKEKFGTEIMKIDLKRVLDTYFSIDENVAKQETDNWIQGATQIVEPSKEEIYQSCKLALAFEKLLAEENATVMTVDCYGSMFEPLCLEYAFPCIGFTRLNNIGLGGICESDLRSAMTHIIFQGLAGKPSFISDPTVDESDKSIILAHCLGTMKMDGPDGASAPFKIRTIMERQAGAVAQVQMRMGQEVTQAILANPGLIRYFTGEIIETPVSLADDRGCRTKIRVKVDGDIEKLWKNWEHGLHRQTCYGNMTKELKHFCRFKEIELVNEAI
jgi:hypothetical protein